MSAVIISHIFRLISSLQKWYGRHYDLVDRYDNGSFPFNVDVFLSSTTDKTFIWLDNIHIRGQVSYKKQELFTLRYDLYSPPDIRWVPCCSSFWSSVLCFVLCLSSCRVFCVQCCQYLLVVYSWLRLRFSLTFIQTLRQCTIGRLQFPRKCFSISFTHNHLCSCTKTELDLDCDEFCCFQ